MLASNPFAAWANTAAGRACKPLALGNVNGLENSRIALLLVLGFNRLGWRQAQQRLAQRDRAAHASKRKRLAADHQHQGQQAPGIERYVVGVELDQRLPGLHPLAFPAPNG